MGNRRAVCSQRCGRVDVRGDLVATAALQRGRFGGLAGSNAGKFHGRTGARGVGLAEVDFPILAPAVGLRRTGIGHRGVGRNDAVADPMGVTGPHGARGRHGGHPRSGVAMRALLDTTCGFDGRDAASSGAVGASNAVGHGVARQILRGQHRWRRGRNADVGIRADAEPDHGYRHRGGGGVERYGGDIGGVACATDPTNMERSQRDPMPFKYVGHPRGCKGPNRGSHGHCEF